MSENANPNPLNAFFSRINWKHVLILAFIFLLAFGIRAYLLRYDLMFEFDTYWHARMTGYVISGHLPAIDPLAYTYLPKGADIPLQTSLFWYISAFFYFIAALFTTGSLAYNKELLIQVVKFLPAFYGAVVCLGLYFLGKELYDRRAGYLMAFFGAVSSSFIYRSMAGFYEAGTMGYVFMVFGFYFVFRAVKRMENTKSMLVNGAIGAVILGLMSLVYALYTIIPIILAFYLIFTVIALLSHPGQKEKAVRFAQLIVFIFVLFFITTMAGPNQDWIVDSFGNVTGALNRISFLPSLPVLIGIAVLIGLAVFLVYKNRMSQKTDAEKSQVAESFLKALKWGKLALLILILIITAIAMVAPKERTGLSAISVGEESPGNQYFSHKFGALIFLAVLSLLLIPIGDYMKKEADLASMLFFPFILISLYLTWDRLHYTYNFGVPLAIASGYVIYQTIRFFQKLGKYEKAIAGIAVVFFLFAGVAHATLFTQQNIPTIEQDSGWKEGLAWLKDNTPPNANMFNWWDEGHWITFLGERTVITDNRNFDQHSNSDVGKFVLTPDLNEAIRILKKYNSDYLLLGADLFSRRNSMIMYAYYSEDPSKVNANDPHLDNIESFGLPCNPSVESGQTFFLCGSGKIPGDQFSQIPTVWTSQPSAMENDRDAVFYYRTKDNARVYKMSLKQNNTIFAKLWFGAAEVSSIFEEVFPDTLPQYKNKELKIFKIHKENFPAS
ncbi:MAG: STT3 domain-containing protein [Candidatus Micrarchaeota archaeon]